MTKSYQDGEYTVTEYDSGHVIREITQAPSTPAQKRKAEIIAILARTDMETGMSRTLRETLIDLAGSGKAQHLKDKETAAAALRAELATLG